MQVNIINRKIRLSVQKKVGMFTIFFSNLYEVKFILVTVLQKS